MSATDRPGRSKRIAQLERERLALLAKLEDEQLVPTTSAGKIPIVDRRLSARRTRTFRRRKRGE